VLISTARVLSYIGSGVLVDIRFGLADLLLDLSLDLLSLALELFARVAGQSADCITDVPFGILDRAFDLVLNSVAPEIVSHKYLCIRVRLDPIKAKRGPCGSVQFVILVENGTKRRSRDLRPAIGRYIVDTTYLRYIVR